MATRESNVRSRHAANRYTPALGFASERLSDTFVHFFVWNNARFRAIGPPLKNASSEERRAYYQGIVGGSSRSVVSIETNSASVNDARRALIARIEKMEEDCGQ